jgi:uncharacterized protein (DUF1015 family)
MALLFPFRALRPAPEAASQVASVPYDVVGTDEARALVAGRPLSFLRVTRPEVDLPASADPHGEEVYAQAVRNLEELKRAAPLVLEPEASLYIYRLRMGSHTQTGVAGCFSLDEYDRGLIKKHERTRKDKEDDRTRHMLELRAQTGVVFLTYPAAAVVDRLTAQVSSRAPLYDFVAEDGVTHTIWRVEAERSAEFVGAFARLPALYIADGHHRAASAARARQTLGVSGNPSDRAEGFLAVAFPDHQLHILPYNRAVADLAGQTPESFLAALRSRCDVRDGDSQPERPGLVSMYLARRWFAVRLPPPPPAAAPTERLDADVLQRTVLAPLLGVGDPRTDKRIDFIGGIRGAGALEHLVDSGQAAVAFSMFPVGIADLMTIADAGGIMPPKSTWFEPKLRDGLLVHLI